MELDLDLSMAIMNMDVVPSTSEVGLLLLHCIVRSRARNTILSELVLMLSPSVKEADSIHVPVMEHGYWLVIGSYLDSNDQELTDTSGSTGRNGTVAINIKRKYLSTWP